MHKFLTLTGLLLAAPALAVGSARAADLPNAPATQPAPPPTNAYLLNLLFTGEGWDNTQGGLRTGAAFMYNMDAQFQADTGKAFGWTGGTFVAEAYFTNATSFGNQYIGAVDQQSPIVTFTLPQQGSVVTAPQGATIALRARSFSSTFPEEPFATVAAGHAVHVTWSPAPTRVHWTLEITAVPPAPAGSVVAVCPNAEGAAASST